MERQPQNPEFRKKLSPMHLTMHMYGLNINDRRAFSRKSRCQNIIVGKGPLESLSGCTMILKCYSNTSILYQGRESNS